MTFVFWVFFYNNLRSVFHDFPLPFLTESGIFYTHLQNQVPGLEPREMLQATYDAHRVFFYVVRSVIPQWWAGRGHLKVRRLPVTPVVPTPFSPSPRDWNLWWWVLNPLQEVATMATIPTQTHPLLTIPFNVATDFTVLAEHCENFAGTLIESNDPSLKIALCGRLNACLTLLQPTLLEPVPPHFIESLTVDTLPANSSVSSLNAQTSVATASL